LISTQAPPDLDTDVVAFRALLPQRFELGGTAWCAGLWPDAVSLWEMLGKTKLIPAGGAAPPPRHVALALAMVDGDGDDPAAVSSALDKVTVAVVAALRPADPAVSLSRSPLDPAVLVRADGSVASAHEPILLARHCGGPDKSRDILLCLFDRRLAVKRPYLHEDAMRPELILTLLDAAEPPADAAPRSAPAPAVPESPPDDDDEDLAAAFYPSEIGLGLLDLWEGKVGSDVTIECADGVVLDAHATILAARSGYFYREFTAPGGEVTKAFLFNGEDSKVMAGVLCFVYGDALVDDHLDLLNDYGATAALLRAAKRLDIHGLAVWVEACLESTMDVAGLPALIDALGPISAPPHARPATPAEAALHAAPLAGLHSLRAAARDFAEDVSAEPDVAAMLLAAAPRDPDFRATLEAALAATIKATSVAALLDLATKVDSEALRVACMAFSRNNLSKVMCDPAFSELLQRRSDLVFELLTALDDQPQAKA